MTTPDSLPADDSVVRVSEEVREALTRNGPVVALETAVVTHGLPREPLAIDPPCPQWDRSAPAHTEIARQMVRQVREAGAVPALIGVLGGTLIIGMDEEELQRLGAGPSPAKASASALAAILAQGGSAGTTVSATLLACGATGDRPIRVFATGGIGGVHRDWTRLPDVSADLSALAHSPVCVVCSGAKSILDLPATRETLESLGVPVIGYRTDHFPMFHHAGNDALGVTARANDPREVAAICRLHWQTLRQRHAILLCQPVPPHAALPAERTAQLVEDALAEARTASIRDSAVTPFLLQHVAQHSDGATLTANLALLLNNARLAGPVAAACCTGDSGGRA